MRTFFIYSYPFTITVVLVAATSLGGVGFLIYDWQKGRATLSELQFSYESAAQKSEYASSVRALLRDIEAERAELTSITANSDPVEIIRLIERAGEAARVSVSVNAVNPGGSYTEDPTLTSLLVALTSEGPFERLNHFLALMETLPLPSIVEQIKLEKHEKGWRVETVIRIFFEEST